MSHNSEVYVLDHQEKTIQSHKWRTAANCLGYLIKSIKPDMKILDIGCGPGSITVDLAAMVPHGHVTGIEIGDDILKQATSLAKERELENVLFEGGDATNLKYPDNSFDLVHAHQVIQHLREPVRALQEMRRVTKPGGLVACREGDIGSTIIHPPIPGTVETSTLTRGVVEIQGGNPHGRLLPSWALKAGFERPAISVTASNFCYSSPEDRAWWADMWAHRLTEGSFRDNALKHGLSSQAELEQYAEGWRKWASEDDGIWALTNVEIICRKV